MASSILGVLHKALKALCGCGFSCLSLVVYIWMHVARLSHGGKLCSGGGDVSDYPIEEQPLHGDLSSRGGYIMGWLIFSWVMMGLGCFCAICGIVVAAAKQR